MRRTEIMLAIKKLLSYIRHSLSAWPDQTFGCERTYVFRVWYRLFLEILRAVIFQRPLMLRLRCFRRVVRLRTSCRAALDDNGSGKWICCVST